MNSKILAGFALSIALWGAAIAMAGFAVTHAMDGARDVAASEVAQG